MFHGLAAFLVILAVDLVWHLGAGLNWFWELTIRDIVEAAVIALVASYLFRLREERILRRSREIQYLNHHIRNALETITLAQHKLEGLEANAASDAINRIQTVLEQISHGENLDVEDGIREKSDESREAA